MVLLVLKVIVVIKNVMCAQVLKHYIDKKIRQQ